MNRLERPQPAAPARKRPRRGLLALMVVVVVIGLLLLIQIVASPVAKSMVNRKLAQMEGFQGEVGRVNIALWRGTVEAHDLVLHDSDYPDDLPVLVVRKAVLPGGVRPLLRGKLGGRARIEGAEVTVIKRERMDDPAEETEEAIQKARAKVKRWQHAMREAMPMELTEVEGVDGRMRFIDRSHEPQVDVEMTNLELIVRNLRNRPDGEELPTTIDITGETTGEGQLEIHLATDPLKEPLEFFTTFELTDMFLPEVNSMMLAYAKIDVTAGTFDVYIEADAANGRYDGYVKPFFEDLEFTSLADEEKSLGRRIVEKIASAATSLLENPDTEKIATQTPFSGTFDENDVDLWATVENLLRNAFLQAIREGLEGWSSSD
jgi:hypothetical protein